jgi:hypothetical protein
MRIRTLNGDIEKEKVIEFRLDRTLTGTALVVVDNGGDGISAPQVDTVPVIVDFSNETAKGVKEILKILSEVGDDVKSIESLDKLKKVGNLLQEIYEKTESY